MKGKEEFQIMSLVIVPSFKSFSSLLALKKYCMVLEVNFPWAPMLAM